jgi:LmbE family N-acetylglucosaminyl deacetylase
MPMNARAVAMVFAHPAHEILVAGLMQRYRPHILFVTRSDSGGESGREDLARRGLERLGLGDRATFLGVSETESYCWAHRHEASPYLDVKLRIEDWLRRVRPTAVLGDAFELSNFHHDLTRALLDAALRDHSRRHLSPESYELPLVCRTEPELWRMRFQEFPFGDFETFELTPEELARKQDLVNWVGLQRVEAALATTLFPTPEREVYRRVPPMRDYGVPPAGLQKHYDDWGRLQVRRGRYREPLLFQDHFVPIARALGLTSPQQARLAA